MHVISMDYSIKKYSITGNIYVWEFKEKNPNRRHWNFTADEAGCDSFFELLRLMNESDYNSRKRIVTATPGEKQINVPNDRNIKWHSKRYIDLKYIKSESGLWNMNVKYDSLEITFDKSKIKELQNAIMKIKNGQGDFAIADNDETSILYFWWNLK